jgi:hypothetical protein
MSNAALVRGVQCVGELACQPHSFVSTDGTAEGFPLEVFEVEVVGPTS